MKEKLKQYYVLGRNRWDWNNTIRRSNDSQVEINGNLRSVKVRVRGRSTVIVPQGCRVRNAALLVRGDNNRLEFEEGVIFTGTIELFGDNNSIRIGKDTRIDGADFVVHNGTRVSIGPRCLFSRQIDVRTTDSHVIMDDTGKRINPDKDIHIGEHVWIGRMTSILKGSHIGANSVIGSMSLVSGRIPEGVIAAGVPAKPIRENVSWHE